jgi:hypothetical protein
LASKTLKTAATRHFHFRIQAESTAVFGAVFMESAEAALFLAQLMLNLFVDGQPSVVVLAGDDESFFAGQLRQPDQVALHLFNQLLLA